MRSLLICPAIAFGLASLSVHAEDDGLTAALARVPHLWNEEAPHRLTLEEYEATLDYWVEQHGAILSVERAGESAEGMGIFLLRITDPEAADEDKQHCLITAMHGGPERSGTTTCFHLIEWLLGDSPDARETRREQIIAFLPIVNPYGYFETDRFGNSLKIDPYTGGGAGNWDFETLSFKKLDRSPEIATVLRIIDSFQPEVHLDLHGTGLQEYPDAKLGARTRYQGQTMIEITGSAYSNYALRPWDWRITEAMIAAGNAAGYPSDRFEADAQRGFWGPGMNAIAAQTWRGRPGFYTAQYGYARYHTLLAALEVGWEASGVARARGMLEIGNGVWEGERIAGYPVDRVKAFIGHYVTAYGNTAAERRKSRVELWQRQGVFAQAVLYPQTDGRDTYVVATTVEAAEVLDADPAAFVERIRGLKGVQAEKIEAFIQAGPEIKFAIEGGGKALVEAAGPIENGIGFRLRLPYRKPEILDVRVNGHRLEEGDTDGYRSWIGNGYTQVQINVPPEKARGSEGLFVITCAYVPGEKRRIGWDPPEAVMEQLEKR